MARRNCTRNQKPVALMDCALQQAGVGADALVVDTHMGSGTTALAVPAARRAIRGHGDRPDALRHHGGAAAERTAGMPRAG